MGDVVALFEDDLNGCSYFESDDGDIGVSMRDGDFLILPINSNDVVVALGGQSNLYKREDLAELIHVVKILIDSDERYLPKLDLIGMEYSDV